MFVRRKIIFAVCLGMGVPSVMAAETADIKSTDQQIQTVTQTNQQLREKSLDQLPVEGQSSVEQQQAGPGKKSSMADYCRKHTC